jgi:hypothetical protein
MGGKLPVIQADRDLSFPSSLKPNRLSDDSTLLALLAPAMEVISSASKTKTEIPIINALY